VALRARWNLPNRSTPWLDIHDRKLAEIFLGSDAPRRYGDNGEANTVMIDCELLHKLGNRLARKHLQTLSLEHRRAGQAFTGIAEVRDGRAPAAG